MIFGYPRLHSNFGCQRPFGVAVAVSVQFWVCGFQTISGAFIRQAIIDFERVEAKRIKGHFIQIDSAKLKAELELKQQLQTDSEIAVGVNARGCTSWNVLHIWCALAYV